MRGPAIVALLIASCVRSSAVECGFGTCPPGTACDELHDLCVDPYQLVSCAMLTDADRCSLDESDAMASGECLDGVCIAQRCGDGLVTHRELCEGERPARGTCVDFAFDYGALRCSPLCSESLAGCRRLGWQFRVVLSPGQVRGFAEDGGVGWAATQNGYLRQTDGFTWEGPFNPDDETFWQQGVWAGGGQVFIVGHDSPANGPTESVIAHFDGAAWRITRSPAPLPGYTAVWGRTPSDVYVVGQGGTAGHFNGSTWTWATVPGGSRFQLTGVWGTSASVWAVGYNPAAMSPEYAAYERVGTTWTQRTITGLPQTALLRGVWASAPDDVFVVGEDNLAALVYHYDGTSWSSMPIPSGIRRLHAIHGTGADEVYAAGSDGTILYYDGRGWSAMVTPTSTADLFAVFAGSTFVVAAQNGVNFLDYAGAGWARPPSLGAPTGDTRAMWATGQDPLFAVGDGCDVFRFDGRQWWSEPVTCGTCATAAGLFNDVWAAGATSAFVAGTYGDVLVRTGSSWACATLPGSVGPKRFTDVWGSSANDVYVGGSANDGSAVALVHYDGTTWTDLSDRIAPMKSVGGIWGSAANDVFVVGDGGLVFHYDGASWTEMASGTASTLNGVWGSAPDNVFAVGGAGTIIRWDGSSWQTMSIPIGLTLPTGTGWIDIAGAGPANIYAIGGRTLLRYNGTSWAPVARAETSVTAGVWAWPDGVLLGSPSGVRERLVGTLE